MTKKSMNRKHEDARVAMVNQRIAHYGAQLWVVDQLRQRGAVKVQVDGISAEFAGPAAPTEAEETPAPEVEKSTDLASLEMWSAQ